VKYAHWTNKEILRLRAMYEVCRRPSGEDLAAAFPRHPVDSVRNKARQLGLVVVRPGPAPKHVQRWLRLAHEHFARVEARALVGPAE